MTTNSLDQLHELIRTGHFVDALRHFDRSRRELAHVKPDLKEAIEADLLSRTGAYQAAADVAERLLQSKGTAPSARARAYLVLGDCARLNGRFRDAFDSYRRAVTTAEHADDLELLCWAQLRSLLIVEETGDRDAEVGMLGGLKRNVLHLGNPHLTAATHECIAELETRRGLLVSARQHLKLASAILKRYPNTWLEGQVCNSDLCIDYLNARFDVAMAKAQVAKRCASASGHSAMQVALLGNIAHLYLAQGRFDLAEKSFRSALDATPRDSRIEAAILEGLARVKLAQDQLVECSDLMDRVLRISRTCTPTRYELMGQFSTRARLMLRLRQFAQLEDMMPSVIALAESLEDPRFLVLVNTLQAEAHAAEGQAETAAQFVSHALNGRDAASVEMWADTERVLAICESRVGNAAAAAESFERCLSLLESVGSRTERLHAAASYVRSLFSPELALPATHDQQPPDYVSYHPDCSSALVRPCASSAERTLEIAASILTHGEHPEFIGREAFELLRPLECVPEACLTRTAADGTTVVLAHFGCAFTRALHMADAAHSARIELGSDNRFRYQLLLRSEGSAQTARVVVSIKRLLRSSHDAQLVRRDEAKRAELWSGDLPVEQGLSPYAGDTIPRILRICQKIASTNLTVLITGETGTGKEVLARAIHENSSRSTRPFIPFNCTAVPREMLDSQLFGYRRGAFTGAHDHFPGVIRAATGGTILLDEIGELGLDIQPKLLRFLESTEIHPLGEAHPLKVDVRIVAATNLNLDRLVADGRFREDLYYRLNVIRFELPPLRDRREEIPPLVQHFLTRHMEELQKENIRLGQETMEYLLLYAWPGNVRQLANELRRIVALAENGAVIMPDHLSREIISSRRTVPASDRGLSPAEIVVRLDQPMSAAVNYLERCMLQHALKASAGRVEPAAKQLGLSRKGLYLKRQRLGLPDLEVR